MKKMITILMVLLVATMAFAADTATGPSNAATVKVTTSNTGVIEHKITSAGITNNPTWNSATVVATKGVDLSNSTSAQDIAYYSMRTNTKKTVGIKVSATPLATAIDESNNYYIPYTLTVGATPGVFVGGAGKTAPTFADIDLDAGTINSYTNGMRFLSQAITVKFSENYTESALEGSYEATIKFTVTAN